MYTKLITFLLVSAVISVNCKIGNISVTVMAIQSSYHHSEFISFLTLAFCSRHCCVRRLAWQSCWRVCRLLSPLMNRKIKTKVTHLTSTLYSPCKVATASFCKYKVSVINLFACF